MRSLLARRAKVQVQQPHMIPLVHESGYIYHLEREELRSLGHDAWDKAAISLKRHTYQKGDPNLLENGMLLVDPEYRSSRYTS